MRRQKGKFKFRRISLDFVNDSRYSIDKLFIQQITVNVETR